MVSVAILILGLMFATFAFWGAADIATKGIRERAPAAVLEGFAALTFVLVVALAADHVTTKIAAAASALLLGLHALPRRSARSTGALGVAIVSIVGLAAVKAESPAIVAFCFAAIMSLLVVRVKIARSRARHLAHA